MIGNLSFKTKYSQLGGSFFLLGVFIVASLSLASAKPLPPDHLSLEVVAAGNLFEWQNAGNDGRNPPDTFDHYVVYIDTRPVDYQKGIFAQITTTELSFLHPVASLTAGQDYYYCVEAWDTNDNTQKSGTLKRFWPRDGYAVDGQILKHKDTVWASWKPYDGDHLKTFVGLSTAMGDNPNVVSWIDVGHQTSYVFTGLNLTAGQTYYVSVKIQDLDAYKGNYGAVICSSNGFTVNLTEVFTDTASTSFFNNALHIVGTRINADDVTTANFSNNGGGIWSYRAPITVTERGIEDRLNAPCEFCLVRPSGEFPTNSADQEI